MYVVHKGSVRLERPLSHNEFIKVDLFKGDFFGELEMIDTRTRSEAATALENCALLVIDAKNFRELIGGNFEVMLRILRKYARRLRMTEDKLELLLHKQPQLAEQIDEILKASFTDESAPPDPKPFRGQAALFTTQGQMLYEIVKRATTIGRDDPSTSLKPDIDLSGLDSGRTVSRRHAKLIYQNGKFWLEEEMGVSNGTFVELTKLSPGNPHAIKDSQPLTFGKVALVFRYIKD